MEEPVAPVGVAKRKDLMDNIKGRLNANVYNAATHYSKNEKDLTEKVKFFEKKIATGQMKDYMTPRYEAAKELLARLQAKRPANMPVAKTRAPRATVTAVAADQAPKAPTPKVPTPKAPTTAPVNGNAPSTVRAPKQRGVIGMVNMGAPRATANGQKSRKRNTAATAATTAKVAKTRNTTAKKNKPSPNRLAVPPGSPAANMGSNAPGLNMNTLRTKLNALPKSRKVTARVTSNGKGNSKPKATTARKPRTAPASNQYLELAIQQALPLPEFYNPYTGVKYTPEDDPIQDIEKAYVELKKIRSDIWRKAATLRKRGTKKTTAAE